MIRQSKAPKAHGEKSALESGRPLGTVEPTKVSHKFISVEDVPGSRSLADRAHRQLVNLIATLELQPGQLLSEASLSGLIGIGRTPVREALLRLTYEKIVWQIPRRGFVVSEVDVQQALLALELLREQDRVLYCRAARRGTEQLKAAVSAVCAPLEAAARSHDVAAFLALVRQAGELVIQASQNSFGDYVSEPLRIVVTRFFLVNSILKRAELDKSAALTTAVLKAIAASDENLTREHVERLSAHYEDLIWAVMKAAF